VIDYRISYDQSTDVYIILATGVTNLFFTASSLQSGSTYKFKVEARNLVGYSPVSNTVTILAARPPDMPINFANNALLTTQV